MTAALTGPQGRRREAMLDVSRSSRISTSSDLGEAPRRCSRDLNIARRHRFIRTMEASSFPSKSLRLSSAVAPLPPSGFARRITLLLRYFHANVLDRDLCFDKLS